MLNHIDQIDEIELPPRQSQVRISAVDKFYAVQPLAVWTEKYAGFHADGVEALAARFGYEQSRARANLEERAPFLFSAIPNFSSQRIWSERFSAPLYRRRDRPTICS